MKSTFFWDLNMKIEFICKVRQLFDMKGGQDWRTECNIFFGQWMDEIKKDEELRKLLVNHKIHLMNKSNKGKAAASRIQYMPVDFIRNSFQHFDILKKTIKKMDRNRQIVPEVICSFTESFHCLNHFCIFHIFALFLILFELILFRF